MGRSALGWLNAIMPKPAARRPVTDAAYGPHRRQRLDVYAPSDFKTPCPIVFFVYGGGWNSGNKSDYEFVGRVFADAGFVSVIADYRLVPEVRYPAFLDDLGAALNWTLSETPAIGGDPSRVFVMGHSAGAYNAIMLALDGERFGLPDPAAYLRGMIGLSGPYDFYPFDVRESIVTFSFAKEPLQSQPVNLVKAQPVPAFLGHGDRDRICLPRNTVALAKALRAGGGFVVERHYRGVGHEMTLLSLFSPLRWRVPIYREVLHFLRSRLKDGAT